MSVASDLELLTLGQADRIFTRTQLGKLLGFKPSHQFVTDCLYDLYACGLIRPLPWVGWLVLDGKAPTSTNEAVDLIQRGRAVVKLQEGLKLDDTAKARILRAALRI